MFCPVCKAEYRENYTRCSDCDVDLVASLPAASDDGDHDPFVHLWSGGPGQMLAEIRSTLDDAKIAYRLIENKDTLFQLQYRTPYEVAVPPSQYERAREILGWSGDDSHDEAQESVSAGEEEVTNLELAEEVGADEATQPLDPDKWDPELATESVWTGGDEDSVDMITSSLSENGIHWRIQGEDRRAEILVLPPDADRAREIIREIAGSTPL